jgi:hypothetical protein
MEVKELVVTWFQAFNILLLVGESKMLKEQITFSLTPLSPSN